ncbi:MAG: SusC/RagA family TonB-linked outer membrane protein [Flagellimonas sp.]
MKTSKKENEHLNRGGDKRGKYKLLLLALLFLGNLQFALAQEKTVTGTISDASGPLPGASIIVKGTSNGTQTDFDGNFTLSNVPNSATLVISYIGYKTVEENVGARNTINVSLEEDAQALDEIVVVGYGSATKKDLTGSTGSVKAEEIAKRPLTQIDQALQGTVSGVVVTSQTGQPGRGLDIRIRGTSSITGGTSPLYVIDGFIGANINGIDPNEIESIDVLKDASATAIYGSRGSNGVVIVTTKSGKIGDLKVDFSVWNSIGMVERRLDMLNPGEFAEIVNITDEQSGTTPTFTDAEIQEIRNSGVGTDWQDEVFRTAITQNYSVALSGGSEKIRYRFSVNHLDQPGTLINQSYKRTTLRSNLDFIFNEKLDLKVNLTGFESKSRNAEYAGNLGDPLGQALIWNPISPIFDENGDYIEKTGLASIGFNPVAEANNRFNDFKQRNFAVTTSLNWKLLDNLTFTTTNAYTTFADLTSDFRGLLTDVGNINGAARAFQQTNEGFSFLNSNYFTYKNTFGKHNFNITALYEQQVNEGFQYRANAFDLSTEANLYYNLGLAGSQQISSSFSDSSLESYMGRINYTFNDKYLLTASYRIDGSSRLVDKYSGFPSVALAWRVSEEGFLKNNETLNSLKIRASYGETGNQTIAPYSSLARINVSNPVFFDGTTPTVTTPLGSPAPQDLRWEVAKQTDIGIDASFFNSRLNITADWYNKNITDLLFSRQVPAYVGLGNIATNLGELNNSGFEFMVDGWIIDNATFKWNSSFNIAFNENEVVSLDGQDNLRSGEVNILEAGQSLGEFTGYEFLGTWKSDEAAEAAAYGAIPGDAKYLDVNGDNAYTTEDFVSIGNALPDFSFGFNTDLEYKNWKLNLLVQGTAGNDIYSSTIAFATGGLGQARHPTLKDAQNVWTPQNESDYPTYSPSTQNFRNSSRFVYDATYAKVKNLSLSYVFPKEILDRLKVNNAEIYVSGQNIWTITDYPGLDPEVTSIRSPLLVGNDFNALPNPTTYTIGIKLGL